MKHRHWYYFLSLEKDIIEISDYIEINPINFDTFSIFLTKVYLSICSEIDVVIKLLAEKSDKEKWEKTLDTFPEKEHPDMEVYRAFINEKFPLFKSVEINLPLYGLSLIPWINFKKEFNPEWWDKYNKVKHSRNKFYKFANLKNVVHSASGLFVILLFYYGYKKDLYVDEINYPKLFSFPNEFLIGAVKWESGRVVIPK